MEWISWWGEEEKVGIKAGVVLPLLMGARKGLIWERKTSQEPWTYTPSI